MKRYRLNAKYVDEALLPARAFGYDFKGDNINAEFETSDGLIVKLEFVSTMNNTDGFCKDFLESFCNRRYGMTLQQYEYHWIDRLDRLDDWWHIVKMVKV